MTRRLCVLNSSYEGSSSPMRDHDPYMDPSPYLDAPPDRCLVKKATAGRQIQELAARGYDAFINFCDGSWDEDRAGIEVVHALERLGQAFSGSGSASYDPTRDDMKLACFYAGVDAPAAVTAKTAGEATRALDELSFPMIVKHPNSYSSIGLTRDSVVTTPATLSEQVARAIGSYGAALIEEYIDGREFTTLVADAAEGEREARVLVPVEFRFPPGERFKHFALKWIDFRHMLPAPVTDDALAERLADISRRFYARLGSSGYGRCDIRMDADGRLFMLELNPNPAVFYPPGQFGECDEILSHDPIGHRGFVELIIARALARQAANRRKWQRRRHPARGYGLFAICDIAAGERVDSYEQQPHFLVSKSHVERCWSDDEKRVFGRYAYPLTDEIHVMWEQSAAEWRPINHSCDPNTWIEGLDLAARRAIGRGEELTIDYATFCGPLMEDFDCHCGAASCRRIIRGTDHREPFVRERYGDHVSDYVRRNSRPRGS